MQATASAERRKFRRHDFEGQHIVVHRFDGNGRPVPLGRLVDLSASGMHIRCISTDLQPGTQIRVCMTLPTLGGIRPFVRSGEDPSPTNEWTGYLAVRRVMPAMRSMQPNTSTAAGNTDVGGQLLDMDEVDRAMLRLYLSTHPLAG